MNSSAAGSFSFMIQVVRVNHGPAKRQVCESGDLATWGLQLVVPEKVTFSRAGTLCGELP